MVQRSVYLFFVITIDVKNTLHKLSLVYLLTTLLLYGCGGGDIASGVCEPPFNLSGRWQGMLTSSVDGRTRSVSMLLNQGEMGGLSGSVVSPPCWPLSNDLSGFAGLGGEACVYNNSVSLGTFSPAAPERPDEFTLKGQQSNGSRTITGRYTMKSKIPGCLKSDRGTVTMNKVG